MKSEAEAFAERLRAALAAGKVSDKPVDLMKFVPRYGGDAVSQQAVSYWLNGKTMPRQKNLRALATLLHMDVACLQYGTDEGRKVRDKQADFKVAALDQHAIDAFIAMPESQRALVRALIEELTSGEKKRKRTG